MMLSCRESSRLLSDRLDRPLRPAERFALRFHLALCRACGRVEKQLDFLRTATSELGKRPEEGDSDRR